jgi:hypothetical protein
MMLSISCGEAPKGPPRPLVDSDGDGIASTAFFGRDCNDNDPGIPTEKEIPGNKIDDNCNGLIDEITVNEGHWRLTTSGQPTSFWDLDIRTHKATALQHINCLQFKFQLRSTVDSRLYNITQWQSGLSYTTATLGLDPKTKETFVMWKLDRPEETVKITLNAIFTSETNVKGTILLQDTDPKIKASVTLNFFGRYVKPSPSDAAAKSFCNICYDSETCPNK